MTRGIAIPSEFDLELETERRRWLRRRFLWLCALGITATVALDARDIAHDLLQHRGQLVGLVMAAECAVSLSLYLAAGAYAIVERKNRAPLERLAILLTVLVGISEIIFERIRIPIELNASMITDPDLRASPIAAALVFTGVAMWIVFINHFLACLLVPWTFREALRPAAILLAAFSLIVLRDVAARQLPPKGLLTIPVLATSVIPGAAICWWRFSRFRKTFQLRFESSRYRMLQNELQAARQLHESFLPPQIESGPIRLAYAYEPMRQIGGDLLYVHRAPNNDQVISVVVLDVTGHGIRAALTVNRLLGELERLFAETPDAPPDKVIRGLNHYIALTLSRHTIFATALALRVDAAIGELQWSGAGHPPAYLRRNGNSTLLPLDSNGLLLGVVDGDDYTLSTSSTRFAPGDILIAYTDGVCEAVDPDGAFLGTAGTQKLIADAAHSNGDAAHWPAALLQAVLNYRKTPVEDDTLIATISLVIA